MNVLFRRNLGFLFDATQIITCKTARRESWIDSFVRNGSEAKDLPIIETIIEKFGGTYKFKYAHTINE